MNCATCTTETVDSRAQIVGGDFKGVELEIRSGSTISVELPDLAWEFLVAQ